MSTILAKLDVMEVQLMPVKGSAKPWQGQASSIILGLGLGMATQFFLDSRQGRRRRAMLMDQVVHGRHMLGRIGRITSRDIAFRLQGALAKTRSRLTSRIQPGEVSDAVLKARVRSRLGRLVSHPHALEASVDSGRVVLKGPVFHHEVSRLLDRISKVRGVREIDDQLEAHAHADGVPSLQAKARPRRERPEFLQTSWSPTARLLGVIAGTRLLRSGPLASTAGTLLLLRSFTNHPLRRLFGIGPYRFINLRKTFVIHAPAEAVFEAFTNYHNFPTLFGDVREVRNLGDGRSRWRIKGPARIPIEWTANVTRYEPGRLIAWRSEPGSMIRTAGWILFDREENGATRIELSVSYNPPAGELGEFLAKAIGSSPRRRLNRDLMILKSKIESRSGSLKGKEVA